MQQVSEPIDWRVVLYASPEKVVTQTMSQFKNPFLKYPKRGQNNRYQSWVSDLKNQTGVYVIGWQIHRKYEPVFYIGCSANWLYTTLVQHFTGNYGVDSAYGVDRRRAIVRRSKYRSCRVVVIDCPLHVVRELEQRMIWAFHHCGFQIINNWIPEPPSNPTPAQILTSYPTEEHEVFGWLRQAQACIALMQQLHGLETELVPGMLALKELYHNTLLKVTPPF